MADNHKYILYGGPEPGNAGEGCKSLGEYLIKKLTEYGDKVAFIDGIYSEEITYTQLLERSIRAAHCLEKFGVKNGDVIGLVSENRLEFPVVAFAAYYLNATLAPINLTYTDREFNHAFNLSKPKILFTSAYAAETVIKVAQQNTSFIKKVVLFGEENPYGNAVEMFTDFINNPKVPQNKVLRPKPVDTKNQVALVMCSSGTTGLPKGVQLTHDNIMVSVSHAKHHYATTRKEDDEEVILLGVIPWFHAFGCITMTSVACLGHKLVSLPKFEEGLFLSCIENYKANIIFMVPPLMVFLAKHPLIDNYDLSSMKELLCGAAPLSKEVEEAVKARLGQHIKVRQGFGMSETTLGVLSQTGDVTKPGGVGTLQLGTWAKVIDTETGEILGPNKRGELCFKGPLMMKGYINNEKETKQTIINGWLHTGDVGYYDEDKEFFIVDRLKELIKYKGYQVPPAEIEAILLANPKIKDTAVVGLPDDEAGELPVAFVVKQEGVDVTEREIIDFVASKASPAKRLHGGVRFIAEIPKNVSGKILRRELRELLKTPKSKL